MAIQMYKPLLRFYEAIVVSLETNGESAAHVGYIYFGCLCLSVWATSMHLDLASGVFHTVSVP